MRNLKSSQLKFSTLDRKINILVSGAEKDYKRCMVFKPILLKKGIFVLNAVVLLISALLSGNYQVPLFIIIFSCFNPV